MKAGTDTELVTLARNGAKEAFGLLVQRYQLTARRFAMRLVGNDDVAQELAQEATLQAYLSLDRLRDPERFKSWLCGIVLNVCRNHLRDREITSFSLEAVMNGLQFHAFAHSNVPVTPEKLAEERETYAIVLDAVNKLTASERDVTLLFYYAQLSLHEISVLQDISVGAVKLRLHRARRRLKTMLQTEHPELVPIKRRRHEMVKVTIHDVVKTERTDEQGRQYPFPMVVLLENEEGTRGLPIWVGVREGQAIAMGLDGFSTQRPMTINFFASVLQAIDAKVEQVRIETLKEDIFYAVVSVRSGKKVSEVDARPSDAMALALLTDTPIFVAKDLFESRSVEVPAAFKEGPQRKGVENIIKELEEAERHAQELRKRIPPKEDSGNTRS